MILGEKFGWKWVECKGGHEVLQAIDGGLISYVDLSETIMPQFIRDISVSSHKSPQHLIQGF